MKRNQRKFAEHGGQARVLGIFSFRVLLPILQVIAAMASVLWMPVMAMASDYARAQTVGHFGSGYSPSGMNVSNLSQAQVYHYDTEFVKNLKATTPALRCCERRALPEKSGNQHVLFMYKPLGANTSQSADGVVGSSIQVSVVNNSSTIGEYSDYVNLSTLSLKTAIDPTLENIHRELAYRLAQTINKLVLNTADGANAVDSKVGALSKAAAIPFGKSDIVTIVQSALGQNVKPFDKARNTMCGLVHPFIVGDSVNDVANNSMTDVLKHTVDGQNILRELPSPEGDEVPVMNWGGAIFYQTTTVTQTSNYLSSGKTALRTYLFGEDAVIAISLGTKEGGQIGRGDWRNMKLYMKRFDDIDRSDPTGTIGGVTSYRVNFVVTLPPDTTMRMRYVDAVSNVA